VEPSLRILFFLPTGAALVNNPATGEAMGRGLPAAGGSDNTVGGMGTVINIDGELLGPHEARVSVFDRGFLYGDSVYEVVRTFRGVPFVLDRHLDRLELSAAKLAIALPPRDWLEAQIARTLAAAANAESYLRIIVTRGSGPIGLDPQLAGAPLSAILVQPFEPFPDWTYARGIRVTIPQVRRQERAEGDSAAKTGNYLNSVLAIGEARRRGYYDALLLDTRGRVSEATSANLFAVRGGTLCTPSAQTGLLQGVTRALIGEIAAEQGIALEECDLLPADLFAADELMLTSTLRGVMPVVEVDDRPIADGRPGPLTRRLQRLLQQRAEQLVAGD
jgi:branched-chain amino acid aminotransferase